MTCENGLNDLGHQIELLSFTTSTLIQSESCIRNREIMRRWAIRHRTKEEEDSARQRLRESPQPQ